MERRTRTTGEIINTITRTILIGALLLAMPTLCRAQEMQDDSDVETPGIVVTTPSEQKSQEEGEDYSDLLTDKPDLPVTTPREDPPPKPSDLPADQTIVVNRRCRLEYRPDLGWYLLKFEKEAGKPDEIARYVLPNQRLETMAALAAAKPNIVFIVSGENCTYRERPYVLVRLALEDNTPAPKVAASKPATVSATLPATAPASSPATKVAQAPAKKSTASSDDIIRKLLEERPGKPILAPPEKEKIVEIAPSVAPAVVEQLPQAWGTMVADRVIRVLPEQEGGWWVAKFESDNTLQEQPVRLLPCKMLTRAQYLSQTKSGKSVRLIVSGEVTRYKGKEYLLLRKVLRQREMGQFR